MLKAGVECPEELVSLVKKRLELTDAELEAAMTSELKSWRDFPNYKRTFERLRPFFAVLVKAGRVPESFYMKFCFPNELGETGEAPVRHD